MKSTTISNYLEAFSNPAGRFRSLAGLEIPREHGEPRYVVRSRTLDIAVVQRGKNRILCCPLHSGEAFDLREYVRGRYRDPQLLLGEVLVFNDRNESHWQDILLTDAPADAFRTRPIAAIPAEDPFELADNETPLVFCEGLAAAEKEGKFGYVNAENQPVIPFVYDWADAFDEGLAVVKRGELFGLIDKQGCEIFAPEYEDLRWRSDNGVVMLCDEGRWTLRSRQGEAVTENTFDFIFDFSEGLASVRAGHKYGYIDRTGTIVIPVRYDEAYSFSAEGLATVVRNGITFCIDTEGMVFD